MKENGGSAFPLKCNVEQLQDNEGERAAFAVEHLQRHQGMSLRDYFAGQALASLVGRAAFDQSVEDMLKKAKIDPETETEEFVAYLAYEFADAMIAQRAKEAA